MTDSDTTDLPKTKLQPTHSHSPGTPPALKFVHECRASMYSFKRFVQKGRKKEAEIVGLWYGQPN